MGKRRFIHYDKDGFIRGSTHEHEEESISAAAGWIIFLMGILMMLIIARL